MNYAYAQPAAGAGLQSAAADWINMVCNSSSARAGWPPPAGFRTALPWRPNGPARKLNILPHDSLLIWRVDSA